MIYDKENMWSDEQAITVSAASDYILDFGSGNSYIPSPNEKGNLEFSIRVVEDFASTNDTAALGIFLQESDTEDFSSFNSFTIATPIDIASGLLISGYRFAFMRLPLIEKRYIRLFYNQYNFVFTAGKIVAGLLLNEQTNK